MPVRKSTFDRGVRKRAGLSAIYAGLGTLGISGYAQAQTFGTNDRRQFESPQNFAIELRLGGWNAAVDREFNGAATPYKDIFGDVLRFLPAVEFDWQIVRIGPVVSLGIGAQAGFSSITAPAPYEADVLRYPNDPSMWQRSQASITGLQVVP